MLAEHDRVIQEQPRVRFTAIAADALEVQIFAYVNTTAWPEYLAIVEDLNFKVLDAVAAAGAQLALPAQSLLLEGNVREPTPQDGG